MNLPRTLITFLLILGTVLGDMQVIDVQPKKHASPVQDAINSLTIDKTDYHVIRLAPGTYREKIHITKTTPPFKLLGESAEITRIVWGDSAQTLDSKGHPIGTFRSSTVTIESDDFAAENLTFENDHGPGVQAVALSIGGDRGVFRNCRFRGWQDTLLLRKNRHFLEQCHIAGSVDFIFGDATAFFQNCHIEILDKGYITAASTPKESDFGFIFSHCRITARPGKTSFLGRPWRPHGSVYFLACQMPTEIHPEGWDNWRNPENEKTARYREWGSSGPGGRPEMRVSWSRQLNDSEARNLVKPEHILANWDPNSPVSPDYISHIQAGRRKPNKEPSDP